MLQYRNTDALVSNPGWNIIVQKTGYITEAGRCLVMQAIIQDRPVVIVLLNSLRTGLLPRWMAWSAPGMPS